MLILYDEFSHTLFHLIPLMQKVNFPSLLHSIYSTSHFIPQNSSNFRPTFTFYSGGINSGN